MLIFQERRHELFTSREAKVYYFHFDKNLKWIGFIQFKCLKKTSDCYKYKKVQQTKILKLIFAGIF